MPTVTSELVKSGSDLCMPFWIEAFTSIRFVISGDRSLNHTGESSGGFFANLKVRLH